jgi:Flp pilus assembly protein TadG
MTDALRSLRSVLRAYWRDESGATAVIMVLATSLALIAIAGMVIDLGHVFLVQRQLQASTDAAAVAGAQNIPAGTAVATATAYSGLTGNKNALNGVTVSFVSGYPTTVSFTSTGVSAYPAVGSQPAANGVRVRQQAVVPMFFLKIVGINTMTVTAKATAGLKGGKGQAVDMEIILDTTASMNSSDPNCSVVNATRESCALAGVQALLAKLNPNLVSVGLMVFPGVSSSSQAQYDYNCSGTAPTIVAYNASPVYSILGLSNAKTQKNGSTGWTAATSP